MLEERGYELKKELYTLSIMEIDIPAMARDGVMASHPELIFQTHYCISPVLLDI